MIFNVNFAQAVDSTQQKDPLKDNIANLEDKDASVRRQAAENLGMLHNSAAIEYLKPLLKDKNPFVRIAALDSLGLLRASSVLKDIMQVLVKDEQDSVRQSAAVALNYIGDPISVPSLIEAVNDKSEGVRYAAINALGTIRYPSSIPVLLNGLKDSNVNMRRSCIESLGRFENNVLLLPALRESMNDSDPAIKAKAVSICGIMKDKESAQVFKTLLKDSDLKVRLTAAGALAQINSQEGIDAAVLGMANSDKMIKIQAAEILGNFDSIKALNALKKASDDKDISVQQAVQMAIAKIKARQPKEKKVKQGIGKKK